MSWRVRDQPFAMTGVGDLTLSPQVNNNLSVNKGIIHLYGYNMMNFESIKNGLIENYGLANVAEATRMKKNNSRSTPLIFDYGGDIPEIIEIIEEQTRTKVGEFKKTPILSRNSQEFGHGKKWCTKPMRCSKCRNKGREMAICEVSQSKCWHCGSEHVTGSRICKKCIYREEILAVKSKERVTRHQAVIIFNQKNPRYIYGNKLFKSSEMKDW